MIGPLEHAEKKCMSFVAKLAIISQVQKYVDENMTLEKARESLMKCHENGSITDAKDIIKEVDRDIGMIDTTLTYFGSELEKKMGVSA